jgi:hypothetical protein
MSKFEAKSIACENGWEETLGLSLYNPTYRVKVPTGDLVVYLNIGYELSFDNSVDDDATLELQHRKPSTAHPTVSCRKCNFRYMTETRFKEWLEDNARELIEVGLEHSKNGTLP